MAMSKVREEEFSKMLSQLDEYDVKEEMVNGTQLLSYFVYERRIGQEMHNPDGTSHYCIDDQHLERVLQIINK